MSKHSEMTGATPSINWHARYITGFLLVLFGLLLAAGVWHTLQVQRQSAHELAVQQAAGYAEVAAGVLQATGRQIKLEQGRIRYYMLDGAAQDAFAAAAQQQLGQEPRAPYIELAEGREPWLRYALLNASDTIIEVSLPLKQPAMEAVAVAVLIHVAAAAIAGLILWQIYQKQQHTAWRHADERARLAAQIQRTESQRTTAQKLLNAALDSTPTAILRVDARGQILHANTAAADMWGYTPSQFEKMQLGQLVSGRTQPLEYFNFHLVGGDSATRLLEQPLQTSGARRDGSTFPVEMTIRRTELPNQTVFLIGATDVSERDRLEEGLRSERAQLVRHVEERLDEQRRRYDELMRASRRKDEFLAAMSHELRTPLNAVLGLSDALLSATYGPLAVQQERPLRMIKESGSHLLDLINDILDISKIETNNVALDIVPVVVQDVCRASLHLVRPEAEQKSQRLALQIAPNIEVVDADERRLRQILVNLLSNAVKFTPEGGRITLQVLTDQEKAHVLFSVIDTGTGIAEHQLKNLFQPFVRLENKMARAEGSGLGLTLVRSLTELHGGSVTVESEEGRGSCFTVALPWHQTAAPVAVPAAVAPPPQRAVPLSGDQQPLILLAEDNEINIATLYDFLEFKDFRVNLAHDGLEALEQVATEPPDLILMDIQMPNLDGLEAIRRIRADAETRDIPIIALTGLAMSGDRERCLEAGADDYLSKPFDIDVLIDKISNLLQRGSDWRKGSNGRNDIIPLAFGSA